MGHALGARERNHCRTRDARCRAIAAKSEGESANRAHAPGRARQLTCVWQKRIFARAEQRLPAFSFRVILSTFSMPDRAHLHPIDSELLPGAHNAIHTCL